MYTKSTLPSQRDYLLYLVCFLFHSDFFLPILAGKNQFWISEFHWGDEDFVFKAPFYLILLFPDFMNEMWVY